MIGVDTNVLVRIFVDDDAGQRGKAVAFFRQRSETDPAYVSALVVAEVSWVLNRLYDLPLPAVRDALEWLFESTNIVVEASDVLRPAVALAVAKGADIADSIIAAMAADAGAIKTVTFDQNAAKRIPGMELLA